MADSTQETNQPTAADGGAVAVHSWERPWSVQEMRNAADDWSLAGDAGMLHYLQDFSQRIISRTHNIQEQVNGLVHESKRVYDEDIPTEAASGADQKPPREQTREEREAALIPKIAEAMRLGFNVIDTAFEKLDVNDVNSDSEEDDGAPYVTETILEPKDPYLSRALPYLIGSQAFMTDDDVGLTEVMTDEEQSDQGSISQSESESESDEDDRKPAIRKGTVLDSDTDTETDSSESESELFGTKDDRSDASLASDEEEVSRQGDPGDFANELAARLGTAEAGDKPERTRERGHSVGRRESKKDSKKDSKKSRASSKSNPQIEDDDEDLFGPPPMDDEDSPFGRKDGLFSSGPGLFDEENDEGGLFDDVIVKKPRPPLVADSTPKVENSTSSIPEQEARPTEVDSRPRTKSGRRVPAGAVSIFGGGDDDLFGGRNKQTSDSDNSEDEEAPLVKAAVQVAPKKPAAVTSPLGLFDDDDDDDLFAAIAPKKKEMLPKKEVGPVSRPATGDLFGDDDDDDLFAAVPLPSKKASEEVKRDTMSQKKLPAGAVPMFGGNQGNSLAAAIRGQRPPSDKESSEEEESESERSLDLSGESSESSMKRSASSAPLLAKKKKTTSPAVSSSSLFAEEPEDAPLMAKPRHPGASTVSKPKLATSKGLFGDDSDEDDLFATPTTTKPKPKQVAPPKAASRPTSLFFDDDEEDSLFGTVPKPVRKQEQAAKPKSAMANDGLFNDEPLTSEVKDVGGVKAQPKVIEQRNMESKPKEAVAAGPAPAGPAPVGARNAPLSLFDNEESGDDLFGSRPLPPKAKPSATQPSTLGTKGTKPRTRSLFEDDDVLFGGEGEDPAVDLFGESSPLSPAEESKPFPPGGAAQTQEITTDPMPGASLKDKVEVKGATISASSTDLFGAGGGSDEPDLFKSKPAKKMDPKVEVRGATTSESSTDKSAKAAGRWKPIGGVPMFGGMDPSVLKKRTGSNTSSPDSDTKPLPPELPGDDDNFFSEPKPQAKPPTSSVPTATRPSSGKLIGKLQANLNLNPNALLPGAAPPPKENAFERTTATSAPAVKEQASTAATPLAKEPSPAAASFDAPIPPSTLQTVQKNRVRAQKRRPPTRKSRIEISASGADLLSPTADSSSASIPVLPRNAFTATPVSTAQSNTTIPATNATKPASASTQRDLFGSDEVDTANLFPTSRSTESNFKRSDSSSRIVEPTVSGAIAPVRLREKKAEPDNFFSDAPSGVASGVPSVPKAMSNIFSEAYAKSKSGYSRVKGPLDNNDEDDLFGGAALKKPEKKVILDISDALFGTIAQGAPNSSSKSKPSKVVMATDGADDIFATSVIKPTVKSTPKQSTQAVINSRITQAVDNDDDDDIFSNSSLTAKKSSKPAVLEKDISSAAQTKSKSKPLPTDDGDIFSQAPSKPAKSTKKATINFDDDDDGDDDDDLFGAMPPPSSTIKKATTKAVSKPNASADPDDIFADLPPSKSRERKAKKKAAPTKGMFEEDDDDNIFAEKPVTKKSSAAKSKKVSNASANIFGKDDEEADIFEDPLNALMS